MKFLPELGSCWGGSMVSPEAEDTGGGRRVEAQGGNCHTHGQATSKRAAKVRSSGGGVVHHWKPKLGAISEESPISEVNRGRVRRLAASDHGKRLEKIKLKPPAKAAPPPSHEEEYWKYSYTMALPAFSPTSLLF